MKRPNAVRSFCRSSSKYSASCAEHAAYVLGCRCKALQRSSPLCMAAARDLLHSAANQTRIFDAQTVIARMLCICITLRAMTCSVCGKCSTLPCTPKRRTIFLRAGVRTTKVGGDASYSDEDKCKNILAARRDRGSFPAKQQKATARAN